MAGYFLCVVPRIAPTGIGTQVDHTGIDRQAMVFNRSSDIASHTEGHGQVGAVCGLKFGVDQYFFTCDVDADEAVDVSCFDCGLLCVEDVYDFDLVVSECEAYEVFGVVLDEIFGDGVIFGHVKYPESEGMNFSLNSQNSSK